MAAKLVKEVTVNLEAGNASVVDLGKMLGPLGINLRAVKTEYDAATVAQRGDVVPVVVSVYDDRSHRLRYKTPPTAFLIRRAESPDHPFSLRIEGDGGTEVLRMEGSFRVGDPQAAVDFPARNVFAANANVVFASAGAYRLVGEVDNGTPRIVTFWVHDGMPRPETPAPGDSAPTGYL